MMFKVPDFVREQKAIRHELVIDREESLESADYDAENVLFGEEVH